eukprot:scaffold132_cov61-Phaeocystis_antarctica.AAC.5
MPTRQLAAATMGAASVAPASSESSSANSGMSSSEAPPLAAEPDTGARGAGGGAGATLAAAAAAGCGGAGVVAGVAAASGRAGGPGVESSAESKAESRQPGAKLGPPPPLYSATTAGSPASTGSASTAATYLKCTGKGGDVPLDGLGSRRQEGGRLPREARLVRERWQRPVGPAAERVQVAHLGVQVAPRRVPPLGQDHSAAAQGDLQRVDVDAPARRQVVCLDAGAANTVEQAARMGRGQRRDGACRRGRAARHATKL